MTFRRPLLAAAAALAACQSEPTPASITLEVPEVLLSKHPATVLVKHRLQSGEQKVSKAKHEFTVEPAAIAEVDASGQLTCKKSGDATVTAAFSGVSAKAQIKCRIVHSLKPKPPETVELTKGAAPYDIVALSESGDELKDVTVKVATKNSGVAQFDFNEGYRVLPKSVGEATATATAGDAKQEFTVKVVRTVDEERLPIADGSTVSITLDPGKYRATLKFNEAKPAEFEWRGARYCNKKLPAAKTHTEECTLRAKGTLVVTNPHFVNTGENAAPKDSLILLEVPP